MGGAGLKECVVDQFGMVIIVLFIALPVLVIALGWIVPLVLSIIGHRRHWPSAKGWRICTVIWGGVAVLMALGVSGLFFIGSRISRGYTGESDAKLFNATAYGGKVATLRTAYMGEAEYVFRDQAGKNFRCVTSNGSVVVPAGTLALHECKFTASDAKGQPWTASFRSWYQTNISVGADAVQDVEFGPPFLVAVNMNWSPVSSKISLDPACADRAGNIYTIKSDRTEAVPSFQVLNAEQEVIWSGKFEFG